MDPLAAIGLTGNVLQFIQFVSTLVSTGSEVYHSVNGASNKVSELERIYKKLSTFASSLQSPRTNPVSCTSGIQGYPALPQTTESIAHLAALQDLAKDCKGLCDQLLETVGTLKVKGTQWRRFKSFQAALKAVWDQKKIEDLESRLDRFERIISLHVFPVLSDQQANLMGMVTLLRQESYNLRLDQGSKLDTISTTLRELTSTTERLNGELSTHESGIMGPSREELFSARNHGMFRANQSSLISSTTIDTLSAEISRLALTERELENISREQEVLRSLNFLSRPVRHENIPVAHEKAFRWMINPSKDPEDETVRRFPNWLRDGNGIFWVSGKPGSGKSTLMKHLADNKTTRSVLEEWAGDLKLVIATHYFWSAGTEMQKSHKGLFQTLLYEIFRTCPSLISGACPARWAQTSTVRVDKTTEWSMSELSEALQILSRQSGLPVRFCFFIDGVDEFDGDHLKLCEILKELSQSINIKLCLASRPWNVFTDAFGNNASQKICIEDLTRDDILKYTESRLTEHQRWNICHFRAEEKQSIIDEITGKAQGVFLWVFLVTKSLRDGLTNGDTILGLRNRLRSLPTDLERFFKHMLEVVDPIYHEKMASFLIIAINAKSPLHFLIYSMHELGYEDEDYALNLPILPFPESEFFILEDECRRRVNARCGGLLDLKGSKVEFLHRTVRDFLFTREMSDFLESKTKTMFSVHLATLKAYVATLKRIPQDGISIRENLTRQLLLMDLLQYATEALEDSEESATDLLNTLEDFPHEPFGTGGLYSGSQIPIESNDNYTGQYQTSCDTLSESILRTELLQAGVDKYVIGKLLESPNYFDSIGEPPLYVAVRSYKGAAGHLRIIDCLLKLRHDPNIRWQVFLDSSPWVFFIVYICKGDNEELFQKVIDAGLFSQFLRCGASRNVSLNYLLADIISDGDANEQSQDVLVTPCGIFIKALFSHQLKHRGSSLQVLDDFLDPSLEPQLHPAVLDVLQQEIRKLRPRAIKMERLRYFAKIAERVVTTGLSLDWEMSFLVPDIVAAFPSTLGSRILELIRQGGGKEDPEAASRKRKAGNHALEQIIKRAKISMTPMV